MEKLETCPVCFKNTFIPFLECKDHTVSGRSFAIQKCTSCSFVFTNPRPEKAAIGPYYESANYISHSNSSAGIFNKVYKLIRNYAIRQKMNLIVRYAVKKEKLKLLDIGCGTGEFLNGCTKKGWETVGVEPSIDAATKAQTNYGLNVQDESFLEKTRDTFDVITLWHVLEHVHDLNDRIKQVSRLLKSTGVVIIAVPNHTSFDSTSFKEHWAAWDVPRHLYHFSPETIKLLMKNHGFHHVSSEPMRFDSYYVSLLSTEYVSGKKNYMTGSWIGLKSNAKAGRDAEKYSSVIYIFGKESTSSK